MSIKEHLINQLQEEILFLQKTKLTEQQLESYKYTIKGDLSESRTFI